jgi:hypothetical protein
MSFFSNLVLRISSEFHPNFFRIFFRISEFRQTFAEFCPSCPSFLSACSKCRAYPFGLSCLGFPLDGHPQFPWVSLERLYMRFPCVSLGFLLYGFSSMAVPVSAAWRRACGASSSLAVFLGAHAPAPAAPWTPGVPPGRAEPARP